MNTEGASFACAECEQGCATHENGVCAEVAVKH